MNTHLLRRATKMGECSSNACLDNVKTEGGLATDLFSSDTCPDVKTEYLTNEQFMTNGHGCLPRAPSVDGSCEYGSVKTEHERSSTDNVDLLQNIKLKTSSQTEIDLVEIKKESGDFNNYSQKCNTRGISAHTIEPCNGNSNNSVDRKIIAVGKCMNKNLKNSGNYEPGFPVKTENSTLKRTSYTSLDHDDMTFKNERCVPTTTTASINDRIAVKTEDLTPTAPSEVGIKTEFTITHDGFHGKSAKVENSSVDCLDIKTENSNNILESKLKKKQASSLDRERDKAETPGVQSQQAQECTRDERAVSQSMDPCLEIDVADESLTDIFKCTICHLTFSTLQHHPCRLHCGECQEERDETNRVSGHVREGEKNSANINTQNVISDEEKGNKIVNCESIYDSFHQKNREKTFSKSGVLTQHMKVHQEERQYTCNECGKRYKDRISLQKHLTIHNVDKKLKYKCVLCDKEFALKHVLKRHIQTHSVEKPYKCSLCVKAYSRSYELKRHEAWHNGDMSFTCSICLKHFLRKMDLNRHQVIHSKDKLSQCTICQKAISSSGDLKRHMKIHSGEKPHKCTVCGKDFIQSGHLKRHMRIHNNEHPYKCATCDRAFNVKSHMQRHIRIKHSGEKPYKCYLCGAPFPDSVYLHSHMRIHSESNLVQKAKTCKDPCGFIKKQKWKKEKK